MSESRVGTVYNVQPVPPDPASTDYLDFGPLRIGVEYRKVDPASLEAAYGDNAADMAEIVDNSPDGGFTDEGVSIHVIDAADGHEYVRFDVFVDEPHYHYVDKAAGTNTLVHYDDAAFGPMMPWTLGQLAGPVAAMVERAGGTSLAASITPELGTDVAAAVEAKLREIGELP
ncbi:MAG: hypothetical protein AAF548_17715 [Actinomycetota bacterium]